MFIEEDELLLAWIREQVVLICDAEPTAFAKYVLALLRKSSTEEDGQSLCITQLEVFLQTHTESFVNKLFLELHDKSYLKQQDAKEPPVVLAPISVRPEKEEAVKGFEEEPAHSIQESQLFGEKSSTNGAVTEKLSRPRILPPEKKPEEEEQAEENLLKANRLIQSAKLGGRRRSIVGLNHMGGNLLRPPGRRNIVRVDQRSTQSRSRSPIRDSRTSDIQDIFVRGKHRRCRNYEVLGYCLRGNQCPFRHDSTPITVGGSSSYGPTANVVTNNEAYNPEAPALNSMPMPTHPAAALHYNQGNAATQPKRQFSNSVLVKRIPPEFNHIYNINEYFSQFGEIKNIQVSFENSPDTALVTYKNASSATNAFKSKKAIFDNRFVYLMYYSPPMSQQPDAFQPQWQPVYGSDAATKQKAVQPRPTADYAKVFTVSEPVVPNESLQTRRSKLRAPGQPAKNLQPISVDSQTLKDEALLKLKTELYLKISEQLQLVLRQAQLTDGRARRAVMDKVTQLQKNLADIRNDLLGLHKKMKEGDRAEA